MTLVKLGASLFFILAACNSNGGGGGSSPGAPAAPSGPTDPAGPVDHTSDEKNGSVGGPSPSTASQPGPVGDASPSAGPVGAVLPNLPETVADQPAAVLFDSHRDCQVVDSVEGGHMTCAPVTTKIDWKKLAAAQVPGIAITNSSDRPQIYAVLKRMCSPALGDLSVSWSGRTFAGDPFISGSATVAVQWIPWEGEALIEIGMSDKTKPIPLSSCRLEVASYVTVYDDYRLSEAVKDVKAADMAAVHAMVAALEPQVAGIDAVIGDAPGRIVADTMSLTTVQAYAKQLKQALSELKAMSFSDQDFAKVFDTSDTMPVVCSAANDMEFAPGELNGNSVTLTPEHFADKYCRLQLKLQSDYSAYKIEGFHLSSTNQKANYRTVIGSDVGQTYVDFANFGDEMSGENLTLQLTLSAPAGSSPRVVVSHQMSRLDPAVLNKRFADLQAIGQGTSILPKLLSGLRSDAEGTIWLNDYRSSRETLVLAVAYDLSDVNLRMRFNHSDLTTEVTPEGAAKCVNVFGGSYVVNSQGDFSWTKLKLGKEQIRFNVGFSKKPNATTADCDQLLAAGFNVSFGTQLSMLSEKLQARSLIRHFRFAAPGVLRPEEVRVVTDESGILNSLTVSNHHPYPWIGEPSLALTFECRPDAGQPALPGATLSLNIEAAPTQSVAQILTGQSLKVEQAAVIAAMAKDSGALQCAASGWTLVTVQVMEHQTGKATGGDSFPVPSDRPKPVFMPRGLLTARP